MKKLTYEERKDRERKKRQAKLDAMPVLGMATYDPAFGGDNHGLDIKFRFQIVRLSKHRVTMRTINGRGTIEVGTKDGRDIKELVTIEMMPCDTTPAVIRNGKVTEIPQGMECSL